LGNALKFKKDFTPEQYLAYLNKKAKNPDALIPEDKEPQNTKFKSKRR
jgi:hypothetical protein